MKKTILIFLALIIALPVVAQAEKRTKIKFDPYGWVRTDFFYDSRESFAPVNELFYLYPYDQRLDPMGEDINANSSSGFFSFITRLGLDIKGSKVGRAEATAKIEIDFGGYGNMNTILRIRQAFVNLNWESGSSLLVGQSWHPLFGDVMPVMNNITVGAPFQPFTRSPQVRYQYKTGGVKLIAAALCQLQYTSNGPNGGSNTYMVNSSIPELFAGVDYYCGGWQFGAGANLLHLSPRDISVVGGAKYKVEEMLSAYTGEVHLRYYGKSLKVIAKSLVGSALDSYLMLGGYGVSGVSGANMEQEYTPFCHSSSWVNVSFGSKLRPSIFVGYTKNLGTHDALLSADKIYGYGVGSTMDGDVNNTAIDQMLGTTVGFTYNRERWSAGLDYSATTAWYGDLQLATGLVKNTHDITNHRVAAQFSYFF